MSDVKYFKPEVKRPQWLVRWLLKDAPFYGAGSVAINRRSIPAGMSDEDVYRHFVENCTIPYTGEREPFYHKATWAELVSIKASWFLVSIKDTHPKLCGFLYSVFYRPLYSLLSRSDSRRTS